MLRPLWKHQAKDTLEPPPASPAQEFSTIIGMSRLVCPRSRQDAYAINRSSQRPFRLHPSTPFAPRLRDRRHIACSTPRFISHRQQDALPRRVRLTCWRRGLSKLWKPLRCLLSTTQLIFQCSNGWNENWRTSDHGIMRLSAPVSFYQWPVKTRCVEASPL